MISKACWEKINNLGKIFRFRVTVVSGLGQGGEIKSGGESTNLILVFRNRLENDGNIRFVFDELASKAFDTIEDAAIFRTKALILATDIPEVAEAEIRDPIVAM